ncbi:MAG: PepSY domain-containing protein [Gammaproteobacteria bacterium]|nr:PepSY domain-containing protein [Gammaproteobacteria bacterium]
MNRAKWFKVHSWVGFKFSIFICFVLITGTLAVFSHEIDWLTNPAMRTDTSSVKSTNWAAIYQKVKQQQPNKKLLHIKAPLDPWFSVELVYLQNESSYHRNFFHPSSGQYLGEGRWYNWQRFFRMAHRHLMLPTIIGIPIVSSVAMGMMLSLITSLVIYRKWWRGLFRMPRRSHRKFFWGDVHRLAGVWSLWFVLIIAVTGIWYLVEVLGLRATYPERGTTLDQSLNTALETNLDTSLDTNLNTTAQQTTEQKKVASVMPSVAVFNQMLATTRLEFPALEITKVFFPQHAGDGVLFQGQASAILVRARANMISFDPRSGEQLALNRGVDLSLHARISEAADPLHFGTFAGLPSKIIYFVFGVILSTLAVSGTYLYGMRIARVNKADPKPQAKFWSAASHNMRWGKWLSLFLITLCLIIATVLFSNFRTLIQNE